MFNEKQNNSKSLKLKHSPTLKGTVALPAITSICNICGGSTVGDGTIPPYFDGTSDGGQILKFYKYSGFWTTLQSGAPVANRCYPLPIAAFPIAGTTSLINIDDYGNMGFETSTTGDASTGGIATLTLASNSGGSLSNVAYQAVLIHSVADDKTTRTALYEMDDCKI